MNEGDVTVIVKNVLRGSEKCFPSFAITIRTESSRYADELT
jgi:hypothetical protein